MHFFISQVVPIHDIHIYRAYHSILHEVAFIMGISNNFDYLTLKLRRAVQLENVYANTIVLIKQCNTCNFLLFFFCISILSVLSCVQNEYKLNKQENYIRRRPNLVCPAPFIRSYQYRIALLLQVRYCQSSVKKFQVTW